MKVLATCQRCDHSALIDAETPMEQRLVCTVCSTVVTVREAITGKRRKPRAATAKVKAARDAIERFEPIPEGGDRLDDLWSAG